MQALYLGCRSTSLQKFLNPPSLLLFREKFFSDPLAGFAGRKQEDNFYVERNAGNPEVFVHLPVVEAVAQRGWPALVKGRLRAGFDLNRYECAIWHLTPQICLMAINMVTLDAIAL